MRLLAIDIGSSSVKAAMLRGHAVPSRIVRVDYSTSFDGVRAEVDPKEMIRAVREAIARVGSVRRADLIAFGTMSPSWVAMDKRGKALTPIVTHQDRRSVEIAKSIEKAVGERRHLQIAGNRPFPGGISSTTAAWFAKNRLGVMRRAGLAGHVSTFLLHQLTGARVTDPSNASFMGLYETLKLGSWNRELCRVVGISPSILPEVREANEIAGKVTPQAARDFHLKQGTPVLVGLMDGSAAMLATGATVGQLLNVSGSTDVLALCTDRPRPHPQLLTRALGVGKKWVQVATLAAAGSSLNWVKEQLYCDLTWKKFEALIAELSRKRYAGSVEFEPYLAGDRMSLEQRQAAFKGLTLASTRDEMLSAMIDALATASAARLPLLEQTGTRIRPTVYLSGGAKLTSRKLLQRDWKRSWKFQQLEEASLRGLGTLAAMSS